MKIKNLIYVYLFTMIVLMATVNKCFARINVYGLISSDTTWKAESSPYIITGNVLVTEGATLIIEPGVVVQFDKDKCLHINGTLLARGTNSMRITFTKNTSDNWGYILFNDSSADAIYDKNGNYTTGSILEYCTVEYAKSDKGAVSTDNAHPFINFCSIQNNETTGICGLNLSNTLKITNCFISRNNDGGIFCSGGIIVISNNCIGNNKISSSVSKNKNPFDTNKIEPLYHHYHANGGGISCRKSESITIIYNIIVNNTAVSAQADVSSYGGGIYCQGGKNTISENAIINNKAFSKGFHETYGGGIYCSDGNNTINNNIIYQNSSASKGHSCYGGGIYFMNCSGTLSGNVISNNIAPSAGSGVFINKSNMTINRNLLTNNSSESSSEKSSKTLSSLYIHSSYPVINYNNIFDNSTSYALYNDNSYGTSTVNAKHNWWGVLQDAGVQSLIFDWVDNTEYGFVDYAPFENNILAEPPISPPRIAKITTTDNKEILITWSPNKEPDTAGYKVYWDTDAGFPFRNSVDVGTQTSYLIKDLSDGEYPVTVTAYDSQYKPGNDSPNTKINKNQTNGNESWFARIQTIILAERLIGTWSGEVNNQPATLHIYYEGNRLAGKITSGDVEESVDVSLEFKNNEITSLTLKGISYKRLDGSGKRFSLDTFYTTAIDLKKDFCIEGHLKDAKKKWRVYKKIDSFTKDITSTPGTVANEGDSNITDTASPTAKGRFGITAKNVSPSLAKTLNTNITEGVVIVAVNDGSPAKEAGMEPNDILIMFDEKPVSDKEQLKELVDQTEAGKQVSMVVLRNDSEKTLTMTIGEQTVNTNETAQEMPSDAVATVEEKTQINFEELISGEKDASLFDSHYSEFNYKYDDVWEAVNYVLSKQKEKIITADKDSGVIKTDLKRHWYTDDTIHSRYYILVEKMNETLTIVKFKLFTYHEKKIKSSTMIEGFTKWSQGPKIKPTNKSYTNKFAMKFLNRIKERLGGNKK